MSERTDTERLDWLEELSTKDIWGQLQYGRYIRKWTMQRLSLTKRMREYTALTPRQAIDAAMEREAKDGQG